MADEGIKDDKEEVEGHMRWETADPPESESGEPSTGTDSSEDVAGHVNISKIGDPRDQPGLVVEKTEEKDDVEGHYLKH